MIKTIGIAIGLSYAAAVIFVLDAFIRLVFR